MGKVLDFFRKKKNNNLINLIIDGKIDYIDETICTPEELFNTTYEGNSLIDLIASRRIKISDSLLNMLFSNPETVYKFSNSLMLHTYLYNIKISEEVLFSTLNGKILLELLTEYRSFFLIDYSDVNNLYFIDLVVNKNLPQFPKRVNHELFNSLLDNNMLDKYINNDSAFKWIVSNITDPRIYNYLVDKKLIDKYKDCLNENVLLHSVDGVTLFEKYSSDEFNFNVEDNIKPNKEFINLLIKNGKFDKLVKADENTMLVEIEPGITLLEYVLNNCDIKELSFGILNPKTVEILNKFNRADVCTIINNDCYKSLSKNCSKGTCIPSFLQNSGENVLSSIDKLSIEDIKSIISMGKVGLLARFNKNYMDTISNGKYLIDILIENNIPLFLNNNNYDEKLCKYLMKAGRYDLVASLPIPFLMRKYNNSTYFENILMALKEGKFKADIKNLFSYAISGYEVQFFYYLAKYGFAEHFVEGLKPMLLETVNYNGYKSTLLEHLLDINTLLILNNYIKKMDLSFDVLAVLNGRGLYLDRKADIDLIEEQKLDYKIYDVSPELYSIGPVTEEGESLLSELETMFMNDGLSDKELVDALVSAYRDNLITNYRGGLEELKSLVNCKKMYPQFAIIKDNSSYYMPGKNYVAVDTVGFHTIKHEIGHALHFMHANGSIPDNVDKMMDDVRNDPNRVNLISDFIKEYRKIQDKLYSDAERDWELFQDKYITPEFVDQIQKYLNENKEKKREQLKKLNLSDMAINFILFKNYSFDSYLNTLKDNFIRNKVDITMYSRTTDYRGIFDILDAIYCGLLHDGKFKDSKGRNVGSLPGHGSNYYSNENSRFIEIVANYASISKSPNCDRDLELLRSLIGDELYFAIEDYYYKSVANSEILDNDVSKSV